jgi:hypothetical protein
LRSMGPGTSTSSPMCAKLPFPVGVSTRRAATQSRVPAAARQPRRAGAGPAAR